MKAVSTEKAPTAIGPYSQAQIAGGFVFASGQIPIIPETGVLAEATSARSTRSTPSISPLPSPPVPAWKSRGSPRTCFSNVK